MNDKEYNCVACGRVLQSRDDIRVNDSGEVYCTQCWADWGLEDEV